MARGIVWDIIEIDRRKSDVYHAQMTKNVPQLTTCAHFRLRRIIQTIGDLCVKPWHQLRILDLGSLEGLFALECASRGAAVVGIEGREANNERARVTGKSMGMLNVEFVTDDVRNLSKRKYGQFDVVICSGILYHLPGEDGCRSIRSIADVCTRLTVIDTHIGLRASVPISWEGKKYYGTLYTEHSQNDSPATKLGRAWASLDNNTSFWISKPSLSNLLRDVGFTSVYEVTRPQSFADFSDRLTFAAIKGTVERIELSPQLENAPEPDVPEISKLQPHPTQVSVDAPLWKKDWAES